MADRQEAPSAATNHELATKVRSAVMLSMSFTSMEPVVFDHVNGVTGRYTHDDYDEAMAALNELQRRADAGHADF